MIRILTLLAIALLAQSFCSAQDVAPATAQEQAAPTATPEQVAPAQETQDEGLTVTEKASRLIAYSYFSRMAQQGAELDLDQIREGARMAFAGEEIGMSREEIASVGAAFDKLMVEKVQAERQALSEANIAQAETFFAENKTKEGVLTLESGVQYKVVKDGEGPMVTATDRVLMRYQGRLIDGTVFDETGEGPPARFAVSGVVRGMTEVLLKMKAGGEVEAYLPADLAYGATGPRDQTGRPIVNSPIGPDAALIFKMELVEILKPEEAPPK